MAVRRTIILAVALAGGIAASQAPEFAQQYRQRIGGAIEELGRVVADFDRDAAKNGMSRMSALALHAQSDQALFRDRGLSMERAIGRLELLSRQRAGFEDSRPLVQPLVLMKSDETTLQGVWRDFSPAVPVTSQGFAWGGAGFVLAGGLVLIVVELVRAAWLSARARRRRRRVIVRPEPVPHDVRV